MKYSQKLALSLEECWSFFSSPINLKILTPSHLRFEIINDLEKRKMYAGQIIAFRREKLETLFGKYSEVV